MRVSAVRVLVFSVLIISCSLRVYEQAFAHAAGASWEQVFNQYKVDVGYDPVTFVAGEPARFDFNVTLEQGGQDVDFGDVWVRVMEGTRTVFATGIHKPSIGRASMTFTFPKSGQYTLRARFEKTGESIVEAEFPVTVTPVAEVSGRKTPRPITLVAWTGWVVAAVGIPLIAFKKKSKTRS